MSNGLEMPARQKVVALLIGIGLFCIVIELIRRGKLREEYSWLWLGTAVVIFVLTMWFDLLLMLSDLIGSQTPGMTLLLFAFFFLMLISLNYSIEISKLSNRVKELAQRLAIHEAQEVDRETKAEEENR